MPNPPICPLWKLSSRAERGICSLPQDASPSLFHHLPQTDQTSLAARRIAACHLRPFRFHRPHKSTHEFFIDLRCDSIHVNARRGEKLTGVVDTIDTRRFNLDLLKTGGSELAAIF